MVTKHLYAVFAPTKEPAPWARMAVCAFATTAPLVAGFFTGHLGEAIYASLLGYLISLNDHLGEVRHRLLIASLSFVVMALGLGLGILLHDHFTLFVLTTAVLSYALGLMGGLGAEAERLLLFSLILIQVTFFRDQMSLAAIESISIYSAIAMIAIFIATIATHLIGRGVGLQYARLRPSFRMIYTHDRRRHIYAFTFVITILAALAFIFNFNIERGYWTIITVMLIFRSSRTEMIYRSIQRLIGTMLGVLLAHYIVSPLNSEEFLILAVFLCALFLPLALKRNYWIASVLVTIFVILLLDIPLLGHLDPALPHIRLMATLYGCGLSVCGVILYWILITTFMTNFSQEN